jgi:hypothetical protein
MVTAFPPSMASPAVSVIFGRLEPSVIVPATLKVIASLPKPALYIRYIIGVVIRGQDRLAQGAHAVAAVIRISQAVDRQRSRLSAGAVIAASKIGARRTKNMTRRFMASLLM